VTQWQPIESAPKDGSVIWVMHEECGQFPMSWNSAGSNHLFAPGDIGIWEMADQSMTWRDGEYGPSYWKPFNPTPPEQNP